MHHGRHTAFLFASYDQNIVRSFFRGRNPSSRPSATSHRLALGLFSHNPPKTPLPFLLGSGSVARAIRWEALRAPLHN